MVAHGTIAFDTLTTSDQVNTGTEKSLDTSYIFNGVLKAWLNLDGSGTIGISDSFNTASVTDNGTGSYAKTLSNAMSNSLYATGGGHSANSSFNANSRVLPSTTTSIVMYTQAGGAMADADVVTALVSGDLA